MEVYLNIAQWGPGIFGAEAASRHYFGKSASALTRREAVLLAVSLPAPRAQSGEAQRPRCCAMARTVERRIPGHRQRARLRAAAARKRNAASGQRPLSPYKGATKRRGLPRFIFEVRGMAVPKRKTSRMKRGNRRSHDALGAPAYVEDKDSGELRRPHHIDLKSGKYRGRQVLKVKEEA